MEELNSICDMVLQNLKQKYALTVYQLWFEDLKLKEMTEQSVTFTTNTDFKRNILEKNYTASVKQALGEVLGFEMDVLFEQSAAEGEASMLDAFRKKAEEVEAAQKLAEEEFERELTVKMESQAIVNEYHFGNFVVGESNKCA